MMDKDFERKLRQYAELTLKVGLNLQHGQRLLMGVPIYNTGVPLEAAPLVRMLVAEAYKMGAKLVDVIWGDDAVLLARYENAASDTFDEYPSWKAQLLLEYVEQGDAILTVLGNDPDLLKDQDPELVTRVQQIVLKNTDPAMEYVRRSAVNWSVIAVAVKSWADRVFSEVPATQRVGRLWEEIFRICRLDDQDPIAAWDDHIRHLVARCEYLNAKNYSELKFTGPDTDITIGLPEGHFWKNAKMTTEDGIPFTANLPTEEILTLPHKEQAEGFLTSSMPLSYGGTLIEDFTLEFRGGRVVRIQAKKGEAVLQRLIETDDGAHRLGEIALVPHRSPIAQSGLLFYNILIDENAASHFALGSAYKSCLEGGGTMSDEEFAAKGGNRSLVHIDFMIGSEDMNVEGITADGLMEPVMRRGEWAFEVG